MKHISDYRIPNVYSFVLHPYAGGVIANNLQQAKADAIEIVIKNILEGCIEINCGDLKSVISSVEKNLKRTDIVAEIKNTHTETIKLQKILSSAQFSESLVRKMNGMDAN